jgi:flagellar biosynthetic protein FlhB
MADESEDDSSKTEEPSQKKLDDARKKGKMVSSREISHFFMILSLLAFITILAPSMGRETLRLFAPLIAQPETIPFDTGGLKQLLDHLLVGTLLLLLLPTLMTIIAAFAPSVIQQKWSFSTESIQPKLEKISPLAGFKRLFGMKALIEFLKNLLKITVIAVVGFLAVWPYREEMMNSLRGGNVSIMELSQLLAGKILIATVIFLFLLSIGDYLYQRFIFMKSMRMTKQEVKDEYKQQEGDPLIKNKIRQLRRAKAQKRMMANVPKADVIITNPTHFAIALQYDPATMPAPKLLAKGVDDVAARIREVAEKNKITIVRNPPLARALYDTAEIDEVIPAEHYQAVARVISYVYKIKGKTPQKPSGKPGASGGGMPTMKLRK